LLQTGLVAAQAICYLFCGEMQLAAAARTCYVVSLTAGTDAFDEISNNSVEFAGTWWGLLRFAAFSCNLLQFAAICCNLLQPAATCCNLLQF
jgi:hypothetical protein